MFIFACLYFLIFFTIMFCFCDLKNILKYTHTLWCFLFFKALKSKEARSSSLRLLTSTLRPFSRLFRVFPKTYVRSQAEERCRPDPAPGNCTGNQGPSPVPQNRAPWGPASWPRSIGATGLCVWFVLSPDVPPAFPLRSPGLGSPPPVTCGAQWATGQPPRWDGGAGSANQAVEPVFQRRGAQSRPEWVQIPAPRLSSRRTWGKALWVLLIDHTGAMAAQLSDKDTTSRFSFINMGGSPLVLRVP